MAPRKQRNKPEARCYHCGDLIEAEDWAEVHRLYTAHVVDRHGKPAHTSQTDTAPTPVTVDE